MADGNFELKLIPAFDGSGSVVEWVKKVNLLHDLCGLKKIESSTDWGEFTVYQKLT